MPRPARTAPFMPPFRLVASRSKQGAREFKVFDANGDRVGSGAASRLGIQAFEQLVDAFNIAQNCVKTSADEPSDETSAARNDPALYT